MITRTLLAAALLMVPSVAMAHTAWSHGESIPAWVRSSCCGPADAHQLTEDQIHDVGTGYKIDGYPNVVPYDRALPSQDGDVWVFYRHDDADGFFSPVLFLPLGS